MTWSKILDSVLLLLPWTIAIASVAGTVALFTWIIMMIARKDRPK